MLGLLAAVPVAALEATPAAAATLNLTGATQVSVGEHTTCARMSSGAVNCWGDGQQVHMERYGQVSKSVAFAHESAANVEQVEVNRTNACARHTDGSVSCWGVIFKHKDGGGFTPLLTAPTVVAGITDAVDIAAMEGTFCAVKANATVVCWGRNNLGQTGQPLTTPEVEAPTAVPGLTSVTDVVAGGGHFCARRTDATVRCWGANPDGRLGADTGGEPSPTPVNPGLTGVLQVDAGSFHTCAVVQVSSNEQVRCWGANGSKQVGAASGDSYSTPATAVSGVNDAAEVSAGQWGTCVLRQTGTVACWGTNSRGELGNGTTSNTPTATPTAVSGLTDVDEIDVGTNLACARVGNQVSCWGTNERGALGRGSNVTHSASAGSVKVGLAEFLPVTPARLLDTRPAGVTVDGQFQQGGVVAGGTTVELTVVNRGGAPSNPKAVSLNITSVGATAKGYVTVWPCDLSKPTASNLNVEAGVTRANLTVVKVPSSGPKAGKVCLSPSVSMHLLADLGGYFPSLSPYVGVQPARLVDTRPTGVTVDGTHQKGGALVANTAAYFQISGRGGLPNPVGGAVLNVTAVNPSGKGFVTVYPCGGPAPTASNLNVVAGVNVANVVVTKLDGGGGICVVASVSTHLLVDVMGYMPTSMHYDAITPIRIADTRPTGTTIDGDDEGGGPTAALLYVEVPRGSVQVARTAVLNVTVVDPPANGFLTVYACNFGGSAPLASNVNFVAGQTTPNSVIVNVGQYDSVCIKSSVATNIIVDLQGVFAY